MHTTNLRKVGVLSCWPFHPHYLMFSTYPLDLQLALMLIMADL